MSLAEYATQFDESLEGEERDIVIGFDFGTSCTKVVIQDPVRRDAYAVPFGELALPGNPYILPSKIGLTPQTHYQLVDLERGGIRGLKRALMLGPERCLNPEKPPELRVTSLELASAFVALVLRKVRIWFLSSFADVYGRNRIRWHMNLGIPARNYDEREIKEAFLFAALSGWLLSVQDGSISIASAKAALAEVKAENNPPGLSRDFINVVPEVAAEVAGYARSPLRQFGLHLIVDIGASTMDVATFRLNEVGGELEYYFLWAEVDHHGCHLLHRRRADEIRNCLDGWLRKLERMYDLGAAMPESHTEYTPPPIRLNATDSEFCQGAVRCVTGVVARTYTKRDPNAREWTSGVPTFVCGGGSNLSLYRTGLISKVMDNLACFKINGFVPMPLPKPPSLRADDVKGSEYHRLAVAYGLSFFFDDIGQIVPPSKVEDLAKAVRVKQFQFVSKDMV